MEERNQKIQEKMEIFEQKQENRREQREFNLDSLYKDLDKISYVDYNPQLYEESLDELKK